MPLIHGANIERKGKFYVVNLIMMREGGKSYNQVYGTYIRENDALFQCKRLNRAGSCDLCKRTKECRYGK